MGRQGRKKQRLGRVILSYGMLSNSLLKCHFMSYMQIIISTIIWGTYIVNTRTHYLVKEKKSIYILCKEEIL